MHELSSLPLLPLNYKQISLKPLCILTCQSSWWHLPSCAYSHPLYPPKCAAFDTKFCFWVVYVSALASSSTELNPWQQGNVIQVCIGVVEQRLPHSLRFCGVIVEICLFFHVYF